MTNQNDFVIDNGTGLAVRTDIQDALQALAGNSSGNSEPSVKYAYQWWADTNAAVMKLRNSSNDGWIELFQLDGTLTLEDGSASAPALSFRDDLDTGIYSAAANTFNIATGGVDRLKLDNSSTVFNEGGNDIDFKIEGDNVNTLFYLDAGNNRIGIGTSTPTGKFSIHNTDDANVNALEIYNDNGNLTGAFSQSTAGDGQISSQTNAGTTNVLIRSNGNSYFNGGFTGFGQTSPDHVVDIKSMGASTPLQVDNQNSAAVYIHLVNTGTSGTFLGSEVVSSNPAAQQRNMSFYVGNSSDSATRFMKLHSEGIELESTATQIRGQNGLTLNFSANSNASGMDGESLDDFEEGTFTPTITSGMDNPTFSRAKGSYVKIGRQVLYQYHVIVTGGTLNGSHLIFGGLPFTSRNDANQAYGGAWLNYQGNTFVKGEEISFHTGLNETGFKCYKQDGTNLNGTDSAVNDITSEILWCGQYIV